MEEYHLGVLGEAQGVEGTAGVLALLSVSLAVPQGLSTGNGNELLQGHVWGSAHVSFRREMKLVMWGIGWEVLTMATRVLMSKGRGTPR